MPVGKLGFIGLGVMGGRMCRNLMEKAGKPVVAFDCDGAGVVCIDGQTGILLQPGDIAGLTRNLVELASDSSHCESL